MTVAEARTEYGRERAGYLGGDEPMFVVTHEPDRCAGRAVVLCSPVFADHLANYNREVLLARALAARGIACLRFHYRRTGSSGGDRDRFTFDSSVADTAEVLALARAQWPAVGVLGTRLSAHIAAAALREVSGAPFVAWDPVVRSRQFFREAFRARFSREVASGQGGPRSVEALLEDLDRDGVVDLLSARLSAVSYHSLRELDFAESLAATSGPVLVVEFRAESGDGPLRTIVEAARTTGRDVSLVASPVGETWWFGSEQILPSRELNALTVDWLAERLAGVATAEPSPSPTSVAQRSARAMLGEGISETAMYLPAEGTDVFGVLAEDATAGPSRAVLQCWGAGGYPNSGPSQFRARISRSFASRGCADLRIDYAGNGESTGTAAAVDLRAPKAPEVRTAATWLRSAFPGLPTLLVANCYGTRVALQIVDVLDPSGIVLLTPPVRDLDHFEANVATQGVRFVLRRGMRGSTLRGLRRPEARARLLRKLRKSLKVLRRRALAPARRDAVSPAFGGPVRDLIERGVPMLIVTLGASSFHAEFCAALDGPLGELIAARPGQVEVVTLQGAASFRDSSAVQDEALTVVVDWFDRHFAGSERVMAPGSSA